MFHLLQQKSPHMFNALVSWESSLGQALLLILLTLICKANNTEFCMVYWDCYPFHAVFPPANQLAYQVPSAMIFYNQQISTLLNWSALILHLSLVILCKQVAAPFLWYKACVLKLHSPMTFGSLHYFEINISESPL